MSVKSEHDSDTRAYQTSCQSYYTDIFAGIGRMRVRFADRAAKKKRIYGFTRSAQLKLV
jgi:hypothetical protein